MNRTLVSLIEAEYLRYKLLGERASEENGTFPFLFVKILKGFVGKVTHTRYQLTQEGKRGLAAYWKQIDEIRSLPSHMTR